MSEKLVNLETFANGSLAEQLNTELQRIIDNIADPNTDADKSRKLTMTITVKPSSKRATAAVVIQTKAALAPVIPSETTIMIDRDLRTGKVLAAEIGRQLPGQISMDLDIPPATEEGATVIDLRKSK